MPSYNFAALGAITRLVAARQLRGDSTLPIDYNRLAQVLTKLKVQATSTDVKAGLERDRQIQLLSNS